MKKIQDFSQFSRTSNINEGGQAIKTSRRIRESEAEMTLKSIEEKLMPLLGNPKKDKDYILIGSLGKKKNPEDSSGDIDLGISSSYVTDFFGVSPDYFLETVYENLRDELPEVLGEDTIEIKLMKGINVISVGWPIEGDFSNGTVQLDIIPISNMEWAKFIFYSPDYKVDESKYKSAHRNWLFQAILSSALKIPQTYDENGDILDYDTYVIRLSDGVYKNSKTYKGATKRLKNPQTIPGKSIFITRDPKKLIDMMFGPDVREDQVKTFEDAWKLVTSPNFIYADKVENIKDNLLKYLTNGGFEIPTELTK
jgi:hypothetical protein